MPKLYEHFLSILMLPFMVIVVIPCYLIFRIEIRQFSLGGVSDFLFYILGSFFILFGFTLMYKTIRMFHVIGKGTLAPWNPTQHLVVSGLYRYMRNPMITGVLSVIIGETLVFHSWNLFIWTGFFFVLNNVYFFFKEEPDLVKRFGENYILYKKNVGRWIPRIKPWDLPNDKL